MSVIKSHDCKMCGGPLEIDVDRQVYRCNYCGISYDYEYFREDNVAEIAQTALSRGEFGAAKDAYDFILNKDPHDFTALKGLVLCACKWKTIHPILHMSKVYIKDDTPALVNALDNCLPEHKEYFLKIEDLISDIDKYKNAKEEQKKLEKDKVSECKIRNGIIELLNANQSRFTDNIVELRKKTTTNGQPLLDIYIFIALFAVAFMSVWLGWWIAVIVALLLIAYAISYNVKKKATYNTLMSEMEPHTKEIERLTNEKDAKVKEAENIKTTYIKKAKALIAMDVELTKA